MAEQRSAYDRANLTDGVRKGRDHLPDPAPLALDVDVDQLEACDRMHGREDWLTQRDRLLEEFGISRKHPHGRRPGEYDSRNTYAREEARRILRFERAQKRGP